MSIYHSSKISTSDWSKSNDRLETKEEYVDSLFCYIQNEGTMKQMFKFLLMVDEEAKNDGLSSDDYADYIYKRLMRLDIITLTFLINAFTYHTSEKYYKMTDM